MFYGRINECSIAAGVRIWTICIFTFVCLKTTEDREKRYQCLLDNMTNKFNILEDIKEDVKEIKNKIN